MSKKVTGLFVGLVFALSAAITHAIPTNAVEIDVFGIDTQWIFTLPDGTTESISLSGSGTQKVLFEGVNVGDALDDSGNGLDEVTTELLSLSLTGVSSTFGSVSVVLNSSNLSSGQLEERANNTSGLLDVDPFAPGDADAFFDVFFEILFADSSTTLFTPVTRISGVTSRKPALPAEYSTIFGSFGETPLYDENSNVTGYYVAGDGAASIPEPTTLALLSLGLAGLSFTRRRMKV
jgi:hypothetical protein